MTLICRPLPTPSPGGSSRVPRARRSEEALQLPVLRLRVVERRALSALRRDHQHARRTAGRRGGRAPAPARPSAIAHPESAAQPRSPSLVHEPRIPTPPIGPGAARPHPRVTSGTPPDPPGFPLDADHNFEEPDPPAAPPRGRPSACPARPTGSLVQRLRDLHRPRLRRHALQPERHVARRASTAAWARRSARSG